MKLIAQKPCRFGGNKYFIGDQVPEDLVPNPQAMVKMGVLAMKNEEEVQAEEKSALVTVKVRSAEGDMPLEVTQDGIQAVFDALSSKAEDAKTIIETITDGDALILLHVMDNRKAVKEAAEERAKALNGEEASEGDE